MVKLRHIPLPGLTPYTRASYIQESLVRRMLDWKKDESLPVPQPSILTFQCSPTYTTGRRDKGKLSPQDIAHLQCDGNAEFHEASRGGQTTFHGPGQLVAYPILDMKRHGLNTRCYTSLLEDVLIKTCGRFGIKASKTENVGVWVDSYRKIAAVGVHTRRYVTSHGIGLNVSTDLSFFDRIVACGLEDKRTTSFQEMGVDQSVVEVGTVFVDEMAIALQGVDGAEIDDSGVDELDNRNETY